MSKHYFETPQRGAHLDRQFAQGMIDLSPSLAWNTLERGADPKSFLYAVLDEGTSQARSPIFLPRDQFHLLAQDGCTYFNAAHLALFSLFYLQQPGAVITTKIFNPGMARVAEEIRKADQHGGEAYVRHILAEDIGYKNGAPNKPDMLTVSLGLIRAGMVPAFEKPGDSNLRPRGAMLQ